MKPYRTRLEQTIRGCEDSLRWARECLTDILDQIGDNPKDHPFQRGWEYDVERYRTRIACILNVLQGTTKKLEALGSTQ